MQKKSPKTLPLPPFDSFVNPVFCLRIKLDKTKPLVWRRIEVLASTTFWDLHSAIQDSFGWLNYHLHEFKVGSLNIGVPMKNDFNNFFNKDLTPDWSLSLYDSLKDVRSFSYTYDFGDFWEHTVHLEKVSESDGGIYPRCLAGKNAAPPEDCGGVYGFEELKEILSHPKTAEYREMRNWLKNDHAKVYWPFDLLIFDCTKVVFYDYLELLKKMKEMEE